MRISTQLVLLALLTAVALPSQDIVLLVDTSGSMANYGEWQPDVNVLIRGILDGNSANLQRFRQTGDASAVLHFAKKLQDGIQILQFGSIKTSEFPFFAAPGRVTASDQIGRGIPVGKAGYRDSKTNKSLAIAVGARLAQSVAGPVRLIVISDFLVDADPSARQRQYVNDFEANAEITVPLIYGWLPDERVQVKLMEVHFLHSDPIPSPPPSRSIQLLEALRVKGSPKSIQFRWRQLPPESGQSYRLIVRETSSGRIAVERNGVLTQSAVLRAPPVGRYSWQVIGKMADDSEVISTLAPLSVDRSGPSPGVGVLLLAILAAGGGIWWYFQRKQAQAQRSQED